MSLCLKQVSSRNHARPPIFGNACAQTHTCVHILQRYLLRSACKLSAHVAPRRAKSVSGSVRKSAVKQPLSASLHSAARTHRQRFRARTYAYTCCRHPHSHPHLRLCPSVNPNPLRAKSVSGSVRKSAVKQPLSASLHSAVCDSCEHTKTLYTQTRSVKEALESELKEVCTLVSEHVSILVARGRTAFRVQT